MLRQAQRQLDAEIAVANPKLQQVGSIYLALLFDEFLNS